VLFCVTFCAQPYHVKRLRVVRMVCVHAFCIPTLIARLLCNLPLFKGCCNGLPCLVLLRELHSLLLKGLLLPVFVLLNISILVCPVSFRIILPQFSVVTRDIAPAIVLLISGFIVLFIVLNVSPVISTYIALITLLAFVHMPICHLRVIVEFRQRLDSLTFKALLFRHSKQERGTYSSPILKVYGNAKRVW
jgi:hypothetical protein